MAEVKDENGRKERFYLYYDGESVAGKVNVTLHRKTGGKFVLQTMNLIEICDPPGKIQS